LDSESSSDSGGENLEEDVAPERMEHDLEVRLHVEGLTGFYLLHGDRIKPRHERSTSTDEISGTREYQDAAQSVSAAASKHQGLLQLLSQCVPCKVGMPEVPGSKQPRLL